MLTEDIYFGGLVIGLIIAVGMLGRGILNDAREYRTLVQDKVREGRSIPSFGCMDYNDNEWVSGLDYFGWTSIGLLLYSVAAIFWPLVLVCCLVYYSCKGIGKGISKFNKAVFSTDAKVFRVLKRDPSILKHIVDDKDHRYYAIAMRLQNAGKIVIDRSCGMTKIGNKEYIIEFK